MALKPKIVNSIYSSKESVRCSRSRVSNKDRHSLADSAEATELVSLNASEKKAVPSGKR